LPSRPTPLPAFLPPHPGAAHTTSKRARRTYSPHRWPGVRPGKGSSAASSHSENPIARHARFDLKLTCEGDLEVDDHHTVEDCALALGQGLDQALGQRRGITRFAHAYAPLDEALARAVIDLSGRACAVVDLGLARESLGGLSCENVGHFFTSLATTGRMALHVDVLRGANDHHRAEAAFKATALALRQAVKLEGPDQVPSTKGVL
jgi:imidazoleglycerol-phosphate dehydratase